MNVGIIILFVMTVIFMFLDELFFTGMHRACNRHIVFFQLFNTQTELEGEDVSCIIQDGT